MIISSPAGEEKQPVSVDSFRLLGEWGSCERVQRIPLESLSSPPDIPDFPLIALP